MNTTQEQMDYRRQVTAPERLFRWSPFSTVTMVAQIKGRVTEGMLVDAVAKVQQRHPLLRVRMEEDPEGVPIFTSEGVAGIPVSVVPRDSGRDWVAAHLEASRRPFEFSSRPAIRLILVQSPEESELIILCHHIICDGLSLAYLARDLLQHLGDPERPVASLPASAPIDLENLPASISTNGIARFFINRMNRQWQADPVEFDEADYLAANQAYWDAYDHRILPIKLCEEATTDLVQICRANGVTVNSALSAAFLAGQTLVQGELPRVGNIGIAASLRDRLPKPAGEGMGFYAGVVTTDYRYRAKLGFWENARRLHRQVKPLFTDERLLGDFASWLHLDPGIMDALNFKRLGQLVAPADSRHSKLAGYARRDDLVSRILKRSRSESLNRKAMGTAMTNLTRMPFPRTYGPLELDRLIMQPGGAFPLVMVNMVLGVVTCSGKLSLVVEHAEQAVDSATVAEITETAMCLVQNNCS